MIHPADFICQDFRKDLESHMSIDGNVFLYAAWFQTIRKKFTSSYIIKNGVSYCIQFGLLCNLSLDDITLLNGEQIILYKKTLLDGLIYTAGKNKINPMDLKKYKIVFISKDRNFIELKFQYYKSKKDGNDGNCPIELVPIETKINCSR